MADFHPVDIGELQHVEFPVAVDLEQCEVGGGIDPDHLRVELRPVVRGHEKRILVAHDMEIGQNIAVLADKKAGPLPARDILVLDPAPIVIDRRKHSHALLRRDQHDTRHHFLDGAGEFLLQLRRRSAQRYCGGLRLRRNRGSRRGRLRKSLHNTQRQKRSGAGGAERGHI